MAHNGVQQNDFGIEKHNIAKLKNKQRSDRWEDIQSPFLGVGLFGTLNRSTGFIVSKTHPDDEDVSFAAMAHHRHRYEHYYQQFERMSP